MKKILLFILLTCNMIAASTYQIEYGNNISLSNPVWEDLYITGSTVTINAPVHGDLIIAGGTVVINDTLTSDITGKSAAEMILKNINQLQYNPFQMIKRNSF